MLKDISKLIINVHGQHDNQALLDPDTHIDFIDKLGDYQTSFAEYKSVYSELNATKKSLNEIITDEAEKIRRIDLLTYQINEIESADLSIDEEDELISEKKKITNAKKITEALFEAHYALSGGEGEEGTMTSPSEDMTEA
jgi:DNA repair protein RecN (Recombination protein N)